MKNQFQDKDIEGGMFIVRESSPVDSTNMGFKSTVTSKVVWSNMVNQEWGLCDVFTDGWTRFYGTKSQLLEKLNNDEHGYRLLSRREFDALSDYVSEHINRIRKN